MTRARHVTPSHTAARIAKLRTLVATLKVRQLLRDEIGEILSVGPSGIRKYLADLGDKVEIVRRVDPTPKCAGHPVYALAMSEADAAAYLSMLDAQALARPAKPSTSPLSIAARDPSRHIHIMQDDAEFKVRIHRAAPPGRDPLVAALFGAGRVEVRA